MAPWDRFDWFFSVILSTFAFCVTVLVISRDAKTWTERITYAIVGIALVRLPWMMKRNQT